MEFEFLNHFEQRMKSVGAYALLYKNSMQKGTWKQYGVEAFHEQTNLIFAVLLYIMEQSLKDEYCTMDDIGSFIDTINIKQFQKGRADNRIFSSACYRLCVLASGSLITDIFNCRTLINVSCLHFGQYKGKFTRIVSFRIRSLVLLPHIGHNIHSISFIFFSTPITIHTCERVTYL